jgi:hypothetical protein
MCRPGFGAPPLATAATPKRCAEINYLVGQQSLKAFVDGTRPAEPRLMRVRFQGHGLERHFLSRDEGVLVRRPTVELRDQSQSMLKDPLILAAVRPGVSQRQVPYENSRIWIGWNLSTIVGMSMRAHEWPFVGSSASTIARALMSINIPICSCIEIRRTTGTKYLDRVEWQGDTCPSSSGYSRAHACTTTARSHYK